MLLHLTLPPASLLQFTFPRLLDSESSRWGLVSTDQTATQAIQILDRVNMKRRHQVRQRWGAGAAPGGKGDMSFLAVWLSVILNIVPVSLLSLFPISQLPSKAWLYRYVNLFLLRQRGFCYLQLSTWTNKVSYILQIPEIKHTLQCAREALAWRTILGDVFYEVIFFK